MGCIEGACGLLAAFLAEGMSRLPPARQVSIFSAQHHSGVYHPGICLFPVLNLCFIYSGHDSGVFAVTFTDLLSRNVDGLYFDEANIGHMREKCFLR